MPVGFCVGGVGFAGITKGALAGAAEGFEALSIIAFFSELSFVFVPPLTETLMAKESTISAMASTQVPFSKKSPVFWTPINCDELEKLDDKPPPLGFCIKTINTSNRQIMIDMITKNKYILLI